MSKKLMVTFLQKDVNNCRRENFYRHYAVMHNKQASLKLLLQYSNQLKDMIPSIS